MRTTDTPTLELTTETPEVAALRREMEHWSVEAPLSEEHNAASDALNAALDGSRRRLADELHRRAAALLVSRDSNLHAAKADQVGLDELVRVAQRELSATNGGVK
jgi:hypothetical protein